MRCILTFLLILSISHLKSQSHLGLEFGYSLSKLSSNKSTSFENGPGVFIGLDWLQQVSFFNDQIRFFKTGLIFEAKGSKTPSTYYDINGIEIRNQTVYNNFNYVTMPVSMYLYPGEQTLLFIETGAYGSYLTDNFLSEFPIGRSFNSETYYNTILPRQPTEFKKIDAGFILGLGFDFNLKNDHHIMLNYSYHHGIIDINNDRSFSSYSFHQRSHCFSLSYLFIKA